LVWIKAGGFATLQALPAAHWNLFTFGGVPWLIGGILLAGFVEFPQAMYWQRIYSANSVRTAKLSNLLVIPFILAFSGCALLIGLLATGIVPADTVKDSVFFAVAQAVLPAGILGLVFAGLLATLMSTIDSIIISGAMVIFKDLYLPWKHGRHPHLEHSADEHKMLGKMRLIAAVFGIIMAAIAFLAPSVVDLVNLAAFTALCMVPAILAAVFWKRTTSRAVVWSMILSLVVLYASHPFIPRLSFAPGFLTAVIVLVVLTLLNRKQIQE